MIYKNRISLFVATFLIIGFFLLALPEKGYSGVPLPPTDPADPVDNTTDPIDNTTDPIDPTDPADPIDPADPADPTDPTDDDEPTDDEPLVVTFIDDEELFVFRNPGLPAQDFGVADAPTAAIVPCDVPVDTNSNDDCFSLGDIIPGIQISNAPPSPGGISVIGENYNNDNANPPNTLVNTAIAEPIDIKFTQDVNAVSLELGCAAEMLTGPGCSGDVFVEVFGEADTLIAQNTFSVEATLKAESNAMVIGVTDIADSFIGIESIEPITRINLRFIDPSGTDLLSILSITFGMTGAESAGVTIAVPTLSEWGLITMAGVLGIVGFMVIRRIKVTA